MAALNEGNVSRARDILDANQDLIGHDTVISVSSTTGIGQN